jgi:hypothetical protein
MIATDENWNYETEASTSERPDLAAPARASWSNGEPSSCITRSDAGPIFERFEGDARRIKLTSVLRKPPNVLLRHDRPPHFYKSSTTSATSATA